VPSTGIRPKADLGTRVRAALERAEQVAAERASAQNARDPAKLKALGREHARLEPIVRAGGRYLKLAADLAAARELADAEQGELAALAREEVAALEPQIAALEPELADLLTPRDPLDDRDAIVEIRAGTGGDEAALFAADLLRMYARYAERRGWKVEPIGISEGNLRGVREAIVAVRGNAYGDLRSESGVHRVQRVPVTESQGRVHTSAAGVLVYPEPVEVGQVQIDESDLRIDVYRSSGKGGQGVNTTDSAVRITHVPTGIVVTCQNERSQLQNKTRALQVLAARLQALAEEQALADASADRASQIRTVDRSERIRTYNFPENRITDHRIGFKAHNLDQVLDGDLDALLDALALADKQSRLQKA
jgi:peptide chain release factor 1